jgi:hypothetical protein
LSGFWKLLIFASILNKLRFHGLWNGEHDTDLQSSSLIWLAGFDFSVSIDERKQNDVSMFLNFFLLEHVPDEIKQSIRKSTYNIFRTLWLYFPIIAIFSE